MGLWRLKPSGSYRCDSKRSDSFWTRGEKRSREKKGALFGPVPIAKSLIGSPMSFLMQGFFIAIQRLHKRLSRLISLLCAETQQHLLGEPQPAASLLLK